MSIRYGWRRQQPDKRDWRFILGRWILPPSVDMRATCPAIYDQGQYGSCTANAAAGAFEFDTLKQSLPDFMPSRMFEYYNTRVLDGDVGYDGGGTLRSANKALASSGVCNESVWPYTDADLLTKPSAAAYTDAKPNAITNYAAVSQDLASMQSVLATGYPIQIGFTVYSSFESPEATATGIIPMPNVNGEQVLGGHAVLIVGYADSIQIAGQMLTNVFLFRNSWGTSWGDKGYGYIPYAYFTDPNLSADLWVINAVPGPAPAPTPTPSPTPQDCTAALNAYLSCAGYTSVTRKSAIV